MMTDPHHKKGEGVVSSASCPRGAKSSARGGDGGGDGSEDNADPL